MMMICKNRLAAEACMSMCIVCLVCLGCLIIKLQHVFHAFLYDKTRCGCHPNAPPGPWRLPLLGNLHQLLLCKPLLTHQALTQLAKKHGPLMCLQMGYRLALFVSTGAMAKAFCQTNDQHFTSRPAFTFCDRLLYGQQNGVAFSTYGPRWRKMRRICMLELFTTKRVISFQKILEEELALLVVDVNLLCRQSVSGSVEMNIAHLAHLMVSNIMGRLVLRKRMCDTCVNGESLLDMFKKTNDVIAPAMTDFLPFFGPLLDFKSRHKMHHTHKHIDAFWTVILHDRRKCREAQPHSPSKDFLDVLLSNQEVIELGDDNIKATLMDILGAGSETSAITIEWAMAELLRNPHCLLKLQGELDTMCPSMDLVRVSSSSLTCPISSSLWARRNVLYAHSSSLLATAPLISLPLPESCPSIPYSRIAQASYLKSVVKETLRLHPPVPLLIPRGSTVGARCEFGDYTFADNLMLFVNAWALGRDGDIWEQPDAFQPDRFDGNGGNMGGATWSSTDFRMLPFGMGRRKCPGMALALCIMELTVATFVRAFHWELPNKQVLLEADMREKSGNAGTRKAEPLVAILRPRMAKPTESSSPRDTELS
ncbi:hypothetical protein GOP47_0027812 [Adiantum capillus-veneris]|nr:hypothetical protein GOP47_0027812 [Adiantum capillus-veneris]